MSNPSILTDLALLLLLRPALFFSCRKYLLRSLYHDLQALSSAASPPSASHADPAAPPPATLPPPSTHTPPPAPPRALHSSVARAIFSVCFSESCVMFFFLLCQGLDLFDPRTRLFNWRLSLFLLLATILVFTPVATSLVLTLSADPGSTRRLRTHTQALTSIIPVALYLFTLSHIPLPAALAASDILSNALSRLVVLGTALLGLLSGFGAVSNAWAFFPLFSRTRTEPTDADITAAEHALANIHKDLHAKTTHRRAHSQPSGQGTWFSRVVPSLRTDEDAQELTGLAALADQMARNLASLRRQRHAAAYSSTLAGKLLNSSGRAFALYCIFRVVTSAINILAPASRDPSHASTSPDLLTHALAAALALLSPTAVQFDDVARISRQLSLALVGLIIATSLRLVLRGVTRALRVTSRNLGASLMLLILAQVMGIYFLSTLVQLRSLFPPPPPDAAADTANLFSTIPAYEVFGSLFDCSFLLAAGSCAFVRWFGERVNGPGLEA